MAGVALSTSLARESPDEAAKPTLMVVPFTQDGRATFEGLSVQRGINATWKYHAPAHIGYVHSGQVASYLETASSYCGSQAT